MAGLVSGTSLQRLYLMSQPYVVTIILNTNRRYDTLACLASLKQRVYENHKVVVLDNASSDGSVETIRHCFPDAHIIELDRNLGYAGNNNAGITAALALEADWIFLLNEDTILAADCLLRLVEAGESDRRIAVVGPMVYHHDEPTVIQSAGGRLGRYWQSTHIAQNQVDQGQFVEPNEVDWISGCAIMIRGAAVEQVGMLDGRFFYYWEDTEWCLRIRRGGWRIMHVPKAKLWHKGVQRNYRPQPLVTYYSSRNRLLMLAKHHAPPVVWLYSWMQILRTLTSWTLKPQWRSMSEHRDAMWRGTMDFLRHRWGRMPS
jgi:GT2 family glycosyltransferase